MGGGFLMELGWINLFGAIIVVLIMIPNIIYVIKNKEENVEIALPKLIVILEQIGRYACIALMWLPLLVWKFGFESLTDFHVYVITNAVLILLYYLFWITYSKEKTLTTGLCLAIIPTMIFLISGLLLRHWLLVLFACVFGIAHIWITYDTHKN